MSRALRQQLHARGVDVRLQLRDAIAGLACKELQAQSVWAVEHLLPHLEAPQLDSLMRALWAVVRECGATERRLRYK